MACRARLVTSWQRVVSSNEMKAALDHPFPGVAYTDITMQPDANLLPDPNVLVVEVVPLTDAQLAILKADAACVVLWEEAILI